MCAQSHAKSTHAKFQFEIVTMNVILGVVYFFQGTYGLVDISNHCTMLALSKSLRSLLMEDREHSSNNSNAMVADAVLRINLFGFQSKSVC